jgi:hypothetical protein
MMKRQWAAIGIAILVALAAIGAQAKTFTWTSSLDVLSMDP